MFLNLPMIILASGLMEDAVLLYRDAYGICRITGLSRQELAERGVYVGNDIAFGFASSWDITSEFISDRAEAVKNSCMLREHPVRLMYLDLLASGKAINHTTLKNMHFYSVLAVNNTAG